MNTQQIAAALLEKDLVICDTETTGLDEHAEVVELGAIDKRGRILINDLVRPTRPSPQVAVDINRLDNDFLQDMGMPWGHVVEHLVKYQDATFVFFNAVFDVAMIEQTHKFHNFKHGRGLGVDLGFIAFNSFDLMELANRHFHRHLEWNKEKSCFKRLSLEKCCELAGIDYPKEAHRAIPDCLVTLELLKFIANDVLEPVYKMFPDKLTRPMEV